VATAYPKGGGSGLAILMAYHPDWNKPVSITDPMGRVTSMQYDAAGNLAAITQPTAGGQSAVTTFSRNSKGLPTSVTSPDGSVVQLSYDGSGNMVMAVQDPGGLNLTTTYAYDAGGAVTGVTDGLNNTTTMAYNAAGQVTSATAPQPFGYVTNFGYDADGRPNLVRRLGLPVQSYATTYTATDQVMTRVSPKGHVTTYVYDGLDRLAQVTDAENRSTQYQYDAIGRVVTVINGNNQPEVRYTYTLNGKVHTLTDANNNTTTYTYDGYDRLIATTYPDGSAESYTLDAAGRVVQMTARDGRIISYTYDNLDRLVSKTVPGSGTYSYTYDLAGRVLTATDSNGPIQNQYDRVGRLLAVTYPENRLVSYEYDALSRRTKLVYPDNSYVSYAYDQLSRLSSIGYDNNGPGIDPGPAVIASYTYDSLSRRTKLTNGNNTSTAYTYSLDNNLLTLSHQWSAEGLTFTYGYDKTGLRTSLDVSDPRFAPLFAVNGTETNTPNNLNQYAVANNKTLTYDRNGNLTSDGTNTYTYDAVNQLTAAVSTKNSTYSYDSFGRRYSKTVDGSTTVFLNDGHQEIMEYDGSGNIQKKYVFGPGIDEPIILEGADSRYYYSAEALGSIIGLSDPNGAVVERYAYSPWGEVSNAGTVGNGYLYTGRRLDNETDSYYYRARQYNYRQRRFFQIDPLLFVRNLNLYLYVVNNSVNKRDPFGLIDEDTAIGWDLHQPHVFPQVTWTDVEVRVLHGIFFTLLGAGAVGTDFNLSLIYGPGYSCGTERIDFRDAPGQITDYGYYTPLKKPAFGKNIGSSASAVVAWGKGGPESWEGPFRTLSFGFRRFSASAFSDTSGNWFGITLGLSHSSALPPFEDYSLTYSVPEYKIISDFKPNE
jgi:RHS repeat-associated protein